MTVSHPLPPSPLLTEDQAAAYLTLQPSTLRAWRYRGGGPRFVPLGRAIRYRIADLDAWLERRVVSNTSEAAALEASPPPDHGDLVNAPPSPPRMSKARPKKSPPPTSARRPATPQASPVDVEYLAEIDAALASTRVDPPHPPPPPVDVDTPPATVGDLEDAVAALVAMRRPRGDAERAAVIAATSGARGVSEIVRGAQAILSGHPPSPSIAQDAPAVADDQDQVAAEDDQVDDHQLAAAAVALLVSQGMSPDLALEDVDIILEGHDLASAEDIAAAVLAMQAERGEEEEESEPKKTAAKKKRTAKRTPPRAR